MIATVLAWEQATRVSRAAALAATGSDVTPWAYAAGLVILLGALIVAIMQLVRMRKVPPTPGEHEAPPPAETPDEPISPDEPR